MELYFPSLILLLSLSIFQAKSVSNLTSPYLSPSLFFPNYQQMFQTFKIFVYESEKTQSAITTSVESLFHSTLLQSPFLTPNDEQAHLFYFPPLDSSTRSLSRSIRDLRMFLPYWNRTLGADHFYVSSDGIGFESDRNLLELKKNSIQISSFPAIEGRFIPHKDITLPPFDPSLSENFHLQINKIVRFLGYFNGKYGQNPETSYNSTLLSDLRGDPEFFIQSEPLDGDGDPVAYAESKFCLFFYGGDFSGIGVALRSGCVPVVITDRPILDLPFMDVLKWSEIAVFVGTREGFKGVKSALVRTCELQKYDRMRELGKIASKHFVWNLSPQPYDAFYTVLYQLWLRRHTIRYARREMN